MKLIKEPVTRKRKLSKIIYHKDLKHRWNKFSLVEQMANIGAEVGRAINWRRQERYFVIFILGIINTIQLMKAGINPKGVSRVFQVDRHFAT